jgi:hypothetical protein
MNEMKSPGIFIWRHRLGAISALLGFFLLTTSCIMYLRYASDPSNLHAGERLQHAQSLNFLWCATFYGSPLLLIVSLFGLGWSRWIGFLVNGSVFLCALMILGAMCGPFGCN